MRGRSPFVEGAENRTLRTLASLLSPLLLSLFVIEALRQYFSQVYLIVWAALFSEPIDLGGLGVAMVMIAALLAPLLLPVLRRILGAQRIALIAATGVALSRLLLGAGLPFGVEVAASCVTVALFGLFLPAYFEAHQLRQSQGNSAGPLVAGLSLALAYDMAIRALGTTVDLSLQPAWLPVQLVLSAVAIASTYLSGNGGVCERRSIDFPPLSPWAGSLLLGAIGPLLFLEYNLFMHASTVSRWINVDYDLMSVLIPVATAIGLFVPRFRGLQKLPVAVLQSLLVMLAVVAFLWLDGWLSAILILVGQICLVLDLRLLFRFAASRTYGWNTSTAVGVALTVGLLVAFVLTFVLTLSFAYAYTADVFRGTEPVSFLVAAIGLGAAVCVAVSRECRAFVPRPRVSWARLSFATPAILLALLAVALQPAVAPQTGGPRSLAVMTYNMHQGFGMDNKLDLEEIAATIRLGDPDIIGLQEADAGRVPSLSVDEVLWLSRRLNMYSSYGPSWGNTYGVAVLSKYPVIGQQRHPLTSALQQRSCLETAIDLGERTITFFSVHLGLESQERQRQLDELLALTADAPAPKILVGDFNANPDSDEIARVLGQFHSAYALAGSDSGYTSPADSPMETIDYVFVSPDIQVDSAEVIPSLASDHLPVVARVRVVSP
jgi:endonuclease/exonuclease/phosphatase family metal-dependent hydrolase